MLEGDTEKKKKQQQCATVSVSVRFYFIRQTVYTPSKYCQTMNNSTALSQNCFEFGDANTTLEAESGHLDRRNPVALSYESVYSS